jgi:hypothetical protein
VLYLADAVDVLGAVNTGSLAEPTND